MALSDIPGHVSHYIDHGLLSGASANRMLSVYRADGGRIRRQAFYQLWRERRALHDQARERRVA